jgi:creatinine amidohydrolase
MQRLVLLLTTTLVMLAFMSHSPSQNENAEGKLKDSRILKLEELSFTDIDRLDRNKTIFFLTFGNLEEHGPHLPVGSDYFQAVGLRDGLISRLRARHPDYDFVIFPILPIGESGANDLARQFEHVGTFNVRFQTLRDVVIDLGANIARKRFQNIFVLHQHGCLLHNMAFNDAAAFVSQRYSVRMVHISGLMFDEERFFNPQVIEKHLGKGWQERLGWDAHAGAVETSVNLYLRGDLVKPEYKQLPPFVARDSIDALRTTYKRPEWRGYWGDPAKGSREMGKDLMEDNVERAFQFAEKALAGEDMSRLPVYPQSLLAIPEVQTEQREYLERYAAQTAEIDARTAKNGSEKRIVKPQSPPSAR